MRLKRENKLRMLRVAVPLIRLLGLIFYKRSYLKGRFFEENALGWYWVLQGIWRQKILGFNRAVPWPVSPFIRISDPSKLLFHPDDINNFQGFGIYFQNFDATIEIGRGSYIAPNVGLITANHDPTNLQAHQPGRAITIGRNCWIGMNATLLPGVVLGDNTIVGAGAVVTKPYPEGNCTLVGNPAQPLRRR